MIINRNIRNRGVFAFIRILSAIISDVLQPNECLKTNLIFAMTRWELRVSDRQNWPGKQRSKFMD